MGGTIDLTLIAATALSFFSTLVLVKAWIPRAQAIGLVGKDMNKPGDVKVAEAGGVWVLISVSFTLLMFIAVDRYLQGGGRGVVEHFALVTVLLLAGFIGFLDDTLGWRRGIKHYYRVLFTFPISIPLVVIKAGYSKMHLPFVGSLDFGPIYPLLLIPMGIVGASNAFNMIAGYNGLEALQAVLLMFFTAIFSYIKGLNTVFEASLIMMSAALAFLLFNKYPAKVFPGNSFEYGFGAYYASLVILGDFQKFGLMLFTLYFIELLLFIRGLVNGVYKENFGKPRRDGYLDLPYSKCYSLTHVALKMQIKIRGRASEKGVVAIVASLQFITGILSMILINYV